MGGLYVYMGYRPIGIGYCRLPLDPQGLAGKVGKGSNVEGERGHPDPLSAPIKMNGSGASNPKLGLRISVRAVPCNYRSCFEILLRYYDKLYLKSLEKKKTSLADYRIFDLKEYNKTAINKLFNSIKGIEWT